jgi:hypothetical protein
VNGGGEGGRGLYWEKGCFFLLFGWRLRRPRTQVASSHGLYHGGRASFIVVSYGLVHNGTDDAVQFAGIIERPPLFRSQFLHSGSALKRSG